ncbi:MAG: hypothetical protein ACI9R3_006408 [Verrucomicrobiales bacterium]|jgi:hypothetical protein
MPERNPSSTRSHDREEIEAIKEELMTTGPIRTGTLTKQYKYRAKRAMQIADRRLP